MFTGVIQVCTGIIQVYSAFFIFSFYMCVHFDDVFPFSGEAVHV